jgi:hypothetical protein
MKEREAMSEVLAATGALVGKTVFKKLVLDLYQSVAQQTGLKLKQWSTERQIENLYRHISQVRKVKTIWQIDKAVDLTVFYCDSHVLIHDKRRKIRHLSDFGTSENVLIQGIAGQGKSILLRYLCSMELARGEYIPIYLELRRVSQANSLKDRIFTAFDSLGLPVDDILFDALAKSGKVLLLLDAFDEVPDEIKARVLTEIEDLVATKPNLRIIVTSRPHQNIQVSSHFLVVVLDNLKGNEYKNVIMKLASKQAWAENLVKHIEKHAGHMREMLCTPLMVALLVLSYKSYQQLPTKLSDFYDSLFQTLLQRHDGTKPGFRRQRGCTLDDAQYRLAFEALCILAKKSEQQLLSGKAMYDLAQQALLQCGLHAKPSAYVDDIVKITCLVLRDGEEHRFIHKTVQEYYTASYIQRKPEPWAIKFYHRVLESQAHGSWGQELAFLSEIDQYRYNKFYLLPAILEFLGIAEQDLDRPKEQVVSMDADKTFGGVYLQFSEAEVEKTGFSVTSEGDRHFLAIQIVNALIPDMIMKVIRRVGQQLSQLNIEDLQLPGRPGGWFTRKGYITVSLASIVKLKIDQELLQFAQREGESLFETARKIRQSTVSEENPSILEGLV